MSETNGIGIAVWIVIGIVVLAGLVFGIRAAIAGVGGTDCITGLGKCNEDKEQELPPASGTTQESTFEVSINKARVGNVAELKEGANNLISFNAPAGRKCQALVLVNDETYVERGKAISASEDCDKELFIKTEELKLISEDNNNKIEMVFVLYKKDAPALYTQEMLHDKNIKVSVRVI